MSAVLNSVYKFTKFSESSHRKPKTTYPHKKPQTRMLLKWGQMGVICPVLVAAW